MSEDFDSSPKPRRDWHYETAGPPIKVKYKHRTFEIRHFYDGFGAGEIKKEGNLRCFHVLGSRRGDPSPCFKDIETELTRWP